MRHLPTLLLTTLLLTSSIHHTPAQPDTISPPGTTINEPEPEIIAEPLPNTAIERIQADLAQVLSLANNDTVTTNDITIARHSRETWSDSCFGLGGPTESCLAALTEGWQVEAIYEDQSFFYRTDLSGNHIRRSTLNNNLPPSLQTRILQTAQTAGFGEPLTITEAQPKLWGGCYGLPTEADICSAIGIYGWQAIVTDGDHYWIYHTDNLGNTILLNELASTDTAIVTFNNSLGFEALAADTTFQSMVIGGFAGLHDVYTLSRDGELSAHSQSHYAGAQQRRSANINPQQLEDFYNQLNENNFNSFNGLFYLPKQDTADHRVVTLKSQAGQVTFADFIFSELPPQLQAITQSWERLQAETITVPNPFSTPTTPSVPTTPVTDSPTLVNNPSTDLPESIQTQVRINLATYLGVPTDQITIQRHRRQTWSDGCLGLGGPAELCLAALTEGWQIEAVDASTNKTYTYRTNLNGDQIRREP